MKILTVLLTMLDVAGDTTPSYTAIKYELVEKFGQGMVDASKQHIKSILQANDEQKLNLGELGAEQEGSGDVITIGSRVRVAPQPGCVAGDGTVRFYGHVVVDWSKDDADPSKVVEMYGVRLDKPNGDCNGSFEEVSYWQCHNNYGVWSPSPAHLGQSITKHKTKWGQNLDLRCVLLPAPFMLGVPTKPRASVVWCRGSQPNHVSNPV